MKNLYFFLLLITFSFPLLAQDDSPGKIIVGGTIGFGYAKNINGGNNQLIITPNRGEFSRFAFSFNPYVGKYISEKLILGINIGYAMDRTKFPDFNNQQQKITANGYSMGLFSRFLLNPSAPLVFQIEPAAIVQYTTEKGVISFSSSNDQDKFLVGGAQVVPILSYRLSSSLNLIGRFGSLQFLAGYWQQSGSSEKNNFIQAGFQFDSSSILFGVEANL